MSFSLFLPASRARSGRVTYRLTPGALEGVTPAACATQPVLIAAAGTASCPTTPPSGERPSCLDYLGDHTGAGCTYGRLDDGAGP